MHLYYVLGGRTLGRALTRAEKINPALKGAGLFLRLPAQTLPRGISRQPPRQPRITPKSCEKRPENHEKRARKRRKTSQKTPKNEPPKIAPLPSVATLSKVRVKDPASGRRGIILTPYPSLLYDERKHNMGHGTPLRVHPWRWREGWRLCFTQTIP